MPTFMNFRLQLHKIIDQIQDVEVLQAALLLLTPHIVLSIENSLNDIHQAKSDSKVEEINVIERNLTLESYTAHYPTEEERSEAYRVRWLHYAKAKKEGDRPFIPGMRLETYDTCYDQITGEIDVFYSRDTKEEVDIIKRKVGGRYVIDSTGAKFKLHNSLEKMLMGLNGVSSFELIDADGESFTFVSIQGARFGIKVKITDEDSEYINPKDRKPFKRIAHELIVPSK